MSTKKKLVISLTSLAIVLVVAVAAVGITLAALNGTVASTFTINYTAYNVKATVTAKYKIGTQGDVNFTGGEPAGTLKFIETQETASGTLKVDDPITLTSTDTYVVVTYTFKNDWTEDDSETKSNLVVSTETTTIQGQEGIKITYDTDGDDDFEETDLSSLAAVAPNETLTIKIKFELTNNATKTVNLSVSLNWKLESQKIEE